MSKRETFKATDGKYTLEMIQGCSASMSHFRVISNVLVEPLSLYTCASLPNNPELSEIPSAESAHNLNLNLCILVPGARRRSWATPNTPNSGRRRC